jgi:hypothetical protein
MSFEFLTAVPQRIRAFRYVPLHLISSFRHKVAKNCALLGYYAASNGNLLETFREKHIGRKNPKERTLYRLFSAS